MRSQNIMVDLPALRAAVHRKPGNAAGSRSVGRPFGISDDFSVTMYWCSTATAGILTPAMALRLGKLCGNIRHGFFGCAQATP